jgi:transposase
MEQMFPHCAGLDVHKKTVVACVLVTGAAGKLQAVKRQFVTPLAGLEQLAAWLLSYGVPHVVMESTGVYWKPVYNVLAPQGEVWVVNAQHVKQVPGRKTDWNDAEWLVRLMCYGLLERSFIPDVEQRELRDLTRYRTRLTAERAAAANRLEKTLEDANIKLPSVVSAIQGVSARAMLEALIGGESDPEVMAELARGRLRAKLPQLEEALAGRMRPHHRFMRRELLTHLDHIGTCIATVNSRIAELTAPDEAIIARLCAVTGIKRHTAEVILAEVGPDVTPFPTAKHLASWACLCPGNNLSAGKRRSGKTRKGQPWLRAALVEAAWAASHSLDTYRAAQFQRRRARRGHKRAAVAVAHSILTIVWHLLANPEAVFTELGGDYFLKKNPEREQRRAVRKLEALGFTVTLTPGAAVAAA